MPSPSTIGHPTDPAFDQLCDRLRGLANSLDDSDTKPTNWPAQQLALCQQYGVFQWFLPDRYGGQDWTEEQITRGYLALSAACLTTTFVITQLTGACRRIAASDNEWLKSRILPQVLGGQAMATLGISHLTTSRRHLRQPVLRAEPHGDGFCLQGFSPWVTGASQADYIVTGATLDDGRQILLLLPTSLAGVSAEPAERLVALTASQTGRVTCDDVELDGQWSLFGPHEDVMSLGGGGNTGGLQTSTLAVGLAAEAIGYLESEVPQRPDLRSAAEALRREWSSLRDDLLRAAAELPSRSRQQLRAAANSLVLRAAQAALTAAKGSGFVSGHPTGRWCREALFFLVWSCPQPVMAANLCELAGLAD
jgi:alkylation response protein AidB-like acyl-CoA dehydrogenase